MEPWSQWRPPLRRWDAGLTSALFAGACLLGWLVLRFGLPYRLMAERARGSDRYLPLAYGAAWICVVGSLLLVARWSVAALRQRRQAWRYPLLALPMIAESWVVGFAVALVVSS